MAVQHSDNTLILGAGASVDQINEDLVKAGLERPLTVTRTMGDRVVVRVPGRQAEVVHRTITENRPGDDVRRDPLVHIGTYRVLGKNAPHAFTAAASAPPPASTAPPWERPPAGTRRPVIALLDSGVAAGHPFLPPVTADDPFVIDAGDHGWTAPPPPADDHPDAGHGTFLAGIVRREAPLAQVLSVRVMDEAGTINESTAIGALRWLLGYHAAGNPVDVVCLAFGRDPGDGTDLETLAAFETAVGEVAADRMPVVASAGNDGVREDPDGGPAARIFPAAWETVTAIGAGTAEHPAEFSNVGAWVDHFLGGVDVVSILPPDRWMRWSGTSFSAASFAAGLARTHVV